MLYMGIDISTTAAKALLINSEGHVVAQDSRQLALSRPFPLWSEQDPADWWMAVVNSIRGILEIAQARDIGAVGLTGQMHGLVALDRDGGVLRPAILWNDQRTAAQCDEIRERIGRKRLIALTGNDALTGFTAPKLLWVRDEEPEVYNRIAKVLLPKDYVRYRLTDQYATDLAGASGTLLLDVANRRWSQEMFDMLRIPSSWLPPTHEGTAQTGAITARASAETGLLEGTPVYAGAGDQAAQAVGVGAVSSERVAITLGTSGVVFAPMPEYAFEQEGRLHAFCHAAPGQWHLMGVMLSAAGSLQWYRDQLAPNERFESLVVEAGDAPPGAQGLIFLPYLTGERTPYPDPLARGAFVGLTGRHTRAHLTRAVLEGVSLGLRDCLELVRRTGVRPRFIIASGGGARSPLWRQILADVLATEIVTVNSQEGAAFGAALLAAVGFGELASVREACDRMIREIDLTIPSENTQFYEELYPEYRALYPALSASFTRLAGLDRAS